ncbi:MAG: cytochrome c biogenesis protein CcsA [Acidobacteriota bacterium]
MEALSQLYLPGAVPLWCALIFALTSIWGYSLVLRGDESAVPFARRSYTLFAFAVVATSAVLLLCLWRRDFRIEYVSQYSGLDLASHFQIAAFWAGQKGSFLIWLLWGALLGIPVARTAGKRLEAPAMTIYTLTQIGLLFILVRENPFVMLAEAPLDGKGLNPLLQDDWMVIHPPVMFIGYALTAVPFSFAVAALWRREYKSWATRAFPWTLAGFLVLGAAILMGGYWAYRTLGWGGYWGWDPVENASLIPWLLLVVLIHGLYMERTRQRYRRANYFLAVFGYLAVLYGTFLTRSGVLADFSVHSFVDLGISRWLIGLMVFFFALPTWLIVTRLREVETRPNEDPLLSRGFFLVLSTLTILTSAVVITVGTSAPIITGFLIDLGLLENLGQVGPEFYNTVNQPLAMMIAFLLAMVPYLTWRGEESGALLKKLIWPTVAGVVVTAAAGLWGIYDPFHLTFVFLAVVALWSNLVKALDRARAVGVLAGGGYLAHVGVGVMLIGFLASSAYDRSVKVTLTQEEPRLLDSGMELTFTRQIPRTAEEKERMEIRVVRENGSEYWAYPKMFINDRTRQLMVNPHIRKMAALDIYISPIEFDPGRPAGAPERIQLTRGQILDVGDLEVQFIDFDLPAGAIPAQLQAGGRVSVGAALDVKDADGARNPVQPLYQFDGSGRIQAMPVPLPGGGTVRVAAINPTDGAVVLDFAGAAGTSAGGQAPKLALDVTEKPLINLVWYGLYVILFGGVLSSIQRFRQSQVLAGIEE